MHSSDFRDRSAEVPLGPLLGAFLHKRGCDISDKAAPAGFIFLLSEVSWVWCCHHSNEDNNDEDNNHDDVRVIQIGYSAF